MMTFKCAECQIDLSLDYLAMTFSYHDENGFEITEGVCGDCIEG